MSVVKSLAFCGTLHTRKEGGHCETSRHAQTNSGERGGGEITKRSFYSALCPRMLPRNWPFVVAKLFLMTARARGAAVRGHGWSRPLSKTNCSHSEEGASRRHARFAESRVC